MGRLTALGAASSPLRSPLPCRALPRRAFLSLPLGAGGHRLGQPLAFGPLSSTAHLTVFHTHSFRMFCSSYQAPSSVTITDLLPIPGLALARIPQRRQWHSGMRAAVVHCAHCATGLVTSASFCTSANSASVLKPVPEFPWLCSRWPSRARPTGAPNVPLPLRQPLRWVPQ